MSKERASFTSDVVTILLGILPDHVSPAGGKTDREIVASTLNTRTGKNFTSLSIKNWFTNMKDRHKAWNELKKWTGIGWTELGCPEVDVEGEKWKVSGRGSGLKQYMIDYVEDHVKIPPQFPVTHIICEALLSTSILKRALNELSKPGRNDLVSVSISERPVRISVGLEREWDYISSGVQKTTFSIFGVRSLNDACCLSSTVKIGLCCEPKNCVMMHFDVDDLGGVDFLFKAII